MSEVYIETLRTYLRGPEWHHSIDIFISSNAKYFSNIEELDHQHYTLWKSFQEIAETILEITLESIGGSLQDLESAIDEIQRQPSRGPREEIVKEFLEQLSSVSDFQTFVEMMKLACDNQEIVHNDIVVPKQYIDALLRMGFPIDAIEAALKGVQGSTSLEELVMAVSAQGTLNNSVIGGEGGGYDYQYDVHDSRPNSSRKYHQQQSSEKQSSQALVKFAKEASDEGEDIDLNELHAKFVIADSILDSFDSSAREEVVSSTNGVFALIKWAENMKLLLNDIHVAFEETLPCKAMCFNCKDGLINWYRELENERLSIDEASTAGNMLSNSELKRMAELDKIAAMGTADEQLLHSLISRHDEVTKRVDALHRQCGLLVASDRRGIKRENIEELYLYLKQQVASGADLGAISDDLHEHVYSVVSSAKGAEVVNLLLDMHIYEDEQAMLQSKIQAIVGSPSRRGNTDYDAGADYHVNGDTTTTKALPISPLTSPRAYQSTVGEKDSPFSVDAKSGSAVVGYLHINDNNDSISSELDHNSLMLADSKDGNRMASGSAQGAVPPIPSPGSATVSGSGEEAYLAGLKTNHKTAITQLKELLENEKASKLKALEDKLSRKRALLKRTQQQHNSNDNGNSDCKNEEGIDIEALIVEQKRAVAEIENDIDETQEQLSSLQDSMVSGLKKRCLHELTLGRRQYALRKAAGNNEDVSQTACFLTPEEKEEAYLAAANALKERFSRDQRALLESLEFERAKQRERVLKQLAARRKNRNNNKNLGAGIDIEKEERDALLAMDLEFDSMQSAALSRAQENALLSLAGIRIPVTDLASDGHRAGGDASEEEAYLDGDTHTASGVHIERGRAWLQHIYNMKAHYMAATTDLLQRMRVEAIQTAADVSGDGTSSSSSSAGVAEIMSKVVCSAFEAQLSDESIPPLNTNKSGKAVSGFNKSRSDTARVKAGILEEFERAKKELDDGFAYAQKLRKEKLAARRSGHAVDSKVVEGEESKSDEENMSNQKAQECMLEKMVDSFLGDQPLPNISETYATANSAHNSNPSTRPVDDASSAMQMHIKQSALSHDDQFDSDRFRIKNSHIETEKSLLMNLENTMAEQKRALEERLRKRKQNLGERDTSVSTDVVDLLNRSVEKMSAHFKNLSKEQLARINFSELGEYLERSVNGERAVLPGSDSSVDLPAISTTRTPAAAYTNATIGRPGHLAALPCYDLEDEEEEGGDGDNAGRTEEGAFLSATAGVKAPSTKGRSREEKVAMAGEVKRISMEYNEENQKLDLMMKIQQARQRQQLQRKLFEKNQKKQQQQQQPSYEAGDKSEYNSVEIGANRGLSSLKLRSPDSLQPAFKGLPPEAYQGKSAIGGGGGGAGYSSGPSKVQAMAHRGMNLGPLMRK